MAVYSVRWNNFNPKLFLSCSADWTVKMWEHTRKHCLMSFDLNHQVGDVAWTPWSSTAFAACTVDGKVHVFDLNENKSEAMCEQKVVRRAKLTKIAFNPKGTDTPVLLVGDDHGAPAAPPARLKGTPLTPLTPASLIPLQARSRASSSRPTCGGRR